MPAANNIAAGTQIPGRKSAIPLAAITTNTHNNLVASATALVISLRRAVDICAVFAMTPNE